jgi:hypothetical protein
MNPLRKYNLLIFNGSDPLPPKGGVKLRTNLMSPFGDLGVRSTNRSGLNHLM